MLTAIDHTSTRLWHAAQRCAPATLQYTWTANYHTASNNCPSDLALDTRKCLSIPSLPQLPTPTLIYPRTPSSQPLPAIHTNSSHHHHTVPHPYKQHRSSTLHSTHLLPHSSLFFPPCQTPHNSAGPQLWSTTSVTGLHQASLHKSSNNCNQTQPDSTASDAPSIKGGKRASSGPLKLYQDRLASGVYREDIRQQVTMELLQNIYTEFEDRHQKQKRPSGLTLVDNVATMQPKTEWWASIFANTDTAIEQEPLPDKTRPKGLYMYGGVGVGKTMLMDVFVECCPREFKLTRTHFHDFMLSVHAQLCTHKGEKDPLKLVADSIRSKTRLLALDEFFVTDVADAMILQRLFSRLWDRGLTLIATSNRAPTSLYEGGLQRQLFLPFIDRLQQQCLTHNMDSVTDYRRLATRTVGVYFVRLVNGHTNDDRLEYQFKQLTDGAKTKSVTLEVAMGRHTTVQRSAGGACLFDFLELCGEAVGAADYLSLVNAYHTIAVKHVPIFNAGNRAMAYRFVTLVDVAYEHKTKLVISAEGYPAALFDNVMTYQDSKATKQACNSNAVVDDNLGFAKDRTVSRLIEMGTIEYAVMHAHKNTPELVLALEEAREVCASTRT